MHVPTRMIITNYFRFALRSTSSIRALATTLWAPWLLTLLQITFNWWPRGQRLGLIFPAIGRALWSEWGWAEGGGGGGVKSLESQVFKVDLNPPSSSSTCWVITVHSIRGELSWIWLTNDLDLASRGICFSTCVRGDITYKVDHFWMFHISTAVVGVQRQQGLVGWPVHGQRHWPTLTT